MEPWNVLVPKSSRTIVEGYLNIASKTRKVNLKKKEAYVESCIGINVEENMTRIVRNVYVNKREHCREKRQQNLI